MKQYSFLGDDDHQSKQKVNFKTILVCAGFMLMVWIPTGYLYFQWR